LHSYLRYYHGSRTHLALEKDAPEPRAVELPEHGSMVALPQVGGLHHRYVRRAAWSQVSVITVVSGSERSPKASAAPLPLILPAAA
jgi:hypothetical protein